MHLTAKIQQSYISLSSVNCDASLHTVNLKNVKETSFRLVQKEKIHEIIANQPHAALPGSAFLDLSTGLLVNKNIQPMDVSHLPWRKQIF